MAYSFSIILSLNLSGQTPASLPTRGNSGGSQTRRRSPAPLLSRRAAAKASCRHGCPAGRDGGSGALPLCWRRALQRAGGPPPAQAAWSSAGVAAAAAAAAALASARASARDGSGVLLCSSPPPDLDGGASRGRRFGARVAGGGCSGGSGGGGLWRRWGRRSLLCLPLPSRPWLLRRRPGHFQG